MQELSTNKKMRIIKLYLAGFSYEEIAKKVGVSKGTVSNVIAALKAGQFPEVSTIPEEIEQLRDLATNIKRNGISPVQANIGLSVLETLTGLGIEPAEVERCHTLLKALSAPDTDVKAMAKSILAIEEVKEKTGLTLQELEAKVISLRKEIERLKPLSVEIENKKEELAQLEDTGNKLKGQIKDLDDHNGSLANSINNLELKESQLASRVADLEERAYAADKQLSEARRDLKTLSKIGMNTEELSKFTAKLKEVAAHHDIKSEDLYRRLLKESRQLDKGLSLESSVRAKRAELKSIEHKITKEQAEQEKLHTSVNQLNSERLKLEAQLAQSRKHLALDINTLSNSSKEAIQEIRDSLKSGVRLSLTEVNKLADEALRVGKEFGRMESNIESFNWIKPLLSMVRGENGLDDYQVRVVGLAVLRAISSWLQENHGQDMNCYWLKGSITNTVSQLERWKS